ncbi:MAG: hypothetical protein C0606_12050 [Hyphomicrobiales bacterium]|nr:MAG: hypothetical protein C0606_12050 [Hyphomicrobiales bacterium]
MSRHLKRTFLVDVLVLFALFISVFAVDAYFHRALIRYDKFVAQYLEDLSELERAIGYGGLIHHFKNYLLRPDEERYYRDSKKTGEKALALIEKISTNTLFSDDFTSLEKARTMALAYLARLDTARKMAREGASARAIDKIVRFDDSEALHDIAQLHSRIDAAKSQEQERLSKILAISKFILLGFAVISAYWLFKVQQNRQKISRAEEELKNKEQIERTNRKLEASNAALQQFAGVVSHDLKGPVRNIALYAEFIAESADKPDEVRQNVGTIAELAARMHKMIEKLLEFARLGFSTPSLEEVNMAERAEKIADEIRVAAADLAPVINIDPDMPPAYADPVLIERVLSNLIQNSVKYVAEGTAPNVRVSGAPATDDNYVLYSITDNGIGIDGQYSKKIFEPMYRLHGKASRYEGVGVGLSLVRAIIQSHGGDIWLDPDYRHGSRFYWTLPSTTGSTQV